MTTNTKGSVFPEWIEFYWLPGLSLSIHFCFSPSGKHILMSVSPKCLLSRKQTSGTLAADVKAKNTINFNYRSSNIHYCNNQ